MPFELDKNVDLERAKTITLGRQELHVAPLTLRKIIALTELMPALNNAEGHDRFERLADVVMLALSRTYPTLTRDELLDSEMTVQQLTAAVDVVTEQAGGVKKPVGESTATSTSTASSDGAGSSPSSALN